MLHWVWIGSSDVCKLAYLQQQHVRHGQLLTVRAANCWGGGWGGGANMMTSVYIVGQHNDVGGANIMNDLCKVAKQSRSVQKKSSCVISQNVEFAVASLKMIVAL